MAQAKVAKPASGARRTVSKEKRREQLIRSTIKCIARNGLSGTTMADVTREAGMSLGIVNLHFQSKEKLLVETLRYVANEYKRGWDAILADDSLDDAARVSALIDHDFSASIANRNKLAVWFAFWGESRSRPTYARICSDSDLQTNASMQAICESIIADGGYSGIDARLVATGYTALADGLWLDLLVDPQEMSRDVARTICLNYMYSFFPGHFPNPAQRGKQ
jgi:TetR/AcrR family transcriptional repressor of bet genes